MSAAVALLIALFTALPAAASGTWLWPAGAHVALGFGSRWTDARGVECTHGGVDLAAHEGDHVRAPVGGHVVFAGQVPAAGGGQTTAITLETDDGLRVSLLPLRAARVQMGEAVAPGDALGELEGSGDGSSPGAHVHLSVKRGDTALDPMTFLALTPGPSEPVAPQAGKAIKSPGVRPEPHQARAAEPIDAGPEFREVATHHAAAHVDLVAVRRALQRATRTVSAASPSPRPLPTAPSALSPLDSIVAGYRGAWGAWIRVCAAILGLLALARVLTPSASWVRPVAATGLRSRR